MANLDTQKLRAQISGYIQTESKALLIQENQKLWRKGTTEATADNGTIIFQDFYRNYKPTSDTYQNYIAGKTTGSIIDRTSGGKLPEGDTFNLTYGSIPETDRVFDKQRLSDIDLKSLIDGGANDLEKVIVEQMGDQVIFEHANFVYRELENVAKGFDDQTGSFFDQTEALTTSDSTGVAIYKEIGVFVDAFKEIKDAENKKDYKIAEKHLIIFGSATITSLLRAAKQSQTIGIVSIWEGGSEEITGLHGVAYHEDNYIKETNSNVELILMVRGSGATGISMSNLGVEASGDVNDPHNLLGGRYKFDLNVVAPEYLKIGLAEGTDDTAWAAPVINFLPTVTKPGDQS